MVFECFQMRLLEPLIPDVGPAGHAPELDILYPDSRHCRVPLQTVLNMCWEVNAMITIKKAGENKAPGTWWITYTKMESSTWQGLSKEDGTKTAWMRCPNGHFGVLSGHEIAQDGKVTPSVQCPEEGCRFHDNVILEGWAP